MPCSIELLLKREQSIVLFSLLLKFSAHVPFWNLCGLVISHLWNCLNIFVASCPTCWSLESNTSSQPLYWIKGQFFHSYSFLNKSLSMRNSSYFHLNKKNGLNIGFDQFVKVKIYIYALIFIKLWAMLQERVWVWGVSRNIWYWPEQL